MTRSTRPAKTSWVDDCVCGLVNGTLYRADLEYRQYYAATRVPALKKRLAEVESQAPLADSYAELGRRDEIAALRQEAEMIDRTIGN